MPILSSERLRTPDNGIPFIIIQARGPHETQNRSLE